MDLIFLNGSKTLSNHQTLTIEADECTDMYDMNAVRPSNLFSSESRLMEERDEREEMVVIKGSISVSF